MSTMTRELLCLSSSLVCLVSAYTHDARAACRELKCVSRAPWRSRGPAHGMGALCVMPRAPGPQKSKRFVRFAHRVHENCKNAAGRESIKWSHPPQPTKRKVAHGHMTSHRGTSQIGATVGVRSRVGQADQGQGLRRIWRWIGTKRRAAVCDGLEVVPPLSPAILMTHEPILTSRARAARTLTPYSDCASRSFGRRPARPNSWRAYCKKRRAHAGINPTLAARAGTTRR